MEGFLKKVHNNKKLMVVSVCVMVILFSFLLYLVREREKEESVASGECISSADYFASIAKEYYEEQCHAASAIEYDSNYKNTDYIVYVYEADFDGDGTQEAFVVIGMAEEETRETVFGQLLFIQDQGTLQPMESAVFIQKDQTYVEQGKSALFHFSYTDGVTNKIKIYDMQGEEEEESYSDYVDRKIVGEEFVPGEDLLERICMAENNGVKPDYQTRIYYNEIFRGVGSLDVTEHFSLYTCGQGLLIKTVRDEYIYGDIQYMSNYSVSPEIKEMDIDGDGEVELAMVTYVQHGTGFHVEDLYIVDKIWKQGWKIYHLLMSEYKPVLEERFCAKNKDGIIRFSFEGEEVGLPYEIPSEGVDYSYSYEIASQVEFSFTPDGRIFLKTAADRISEISPIGFGPDHGLQTEVLFKDGKWGFSDISYRDTGIDFKISVGISAWIGGYAKDYDSYFWDEIDQEQKKDADIKGKSISYVEIRYPAGQVESGNVKAEVDVWLEGEDEAISFEVWMVYGIRKDREGWFISDLCRLST